MNISKLKSFEILGQTITFERVDNLKELEALGISNFQSNEIKVIKDSKGNPISKDQINSTICHEIVHQWLYNLNMHELNTKESEVDKLGQALYQFLKTAKLS